jgi:hypothetical protein
MQLKIEGAICKSGVPSTHLMVEDGLGRQTNIGSVTLSRQDIDLSGVPIFSPAPGVQIGTITRSWWDVEDLWRIEGDIRDSREARYWMTQKHHVRGQWRECGLCPLLLFPDAETPAGVHNVNLSFERLNITLPTHSGFKESWVRFADPTVKYIPPTAEPGKITLGDIFMGRGF